MTPLEALLLAALAALLVANGAATLELRRRQTALKFAADRLCSALGSSARVRPSSNTTAYFNSCVEQACEQLASLEHRIEQRHPVTGLETREVLLAQLAGSSDRGVLGVIVLADFDALAAFDIDAADQVLTSISQRMVRMMPDHRLVAQVDRASFAVWFDHSVARDAERELEALCYALRERVLAPGVEFLPQIRHSHVLVANPMVDGPALLAKALSAAHSGKADGTTHDIIANADFLALEQDLRQAVARHQFELWYQPVVNAAAGSLSSVEALLRWRHPVRGLIPPSQFVPVVETLGLSEEIGHWVLDRAARDAAAWTRAGLEGVKVAVNLSAHQLVRADLDVIIQRLIARHGLPPEMLELELTETAAAVDSASARALFSRLRQRGITIAIDDFGAGYSSLSYLKRLEFDKLKIDREFISNVDTDKHAQAICQSIIALARGLGLTVLGEGVERHEEYAWLRHQGCQLFQGYYFSRPLPYAGLLGFAASPAAIVEKCAVGIMPQSGPIGVLAA